MKKNFVFVKLFVSLFLVVVLIGTLCFAKLHSVISPNDIVEYSAKVDSISKTNVSGEKNYKISTEEYEYDLLVPEPKNKNLKFNDINNGDIIVFGVEKKYVDLLNTHVPTIDDIFVPIVSLKTENQTILALNDYNQYFNDIGFEPTLICVVMIFISFIAFMKSIKQISHITD